MLRTYSTCSYRGYQDTTTYAALNKNRLVTRPSNVYYIAVPVSLLEWCWAWVVNHSVFFLILCLFSYVYYLARWTSVLFGGERDFCLWWSQKQGCGWVIFQCKMAGKRIVNTTLSWQDDAFSHMFITWHAGLLSSLARSDVCWWCVYAIAIHIQTKITK